MDPLRKARRVFIVGIKGVAMANIAIILKQMGLNVSGVDTEETFITDELLEKNKISFIENFSKAALPTDCDLILYSAAHGGSANHLVVIAKKNNVSTLSQAEFVGALMKYFKTKIAVTGCHGKTTTSSLLAHSLIKLEARPSYLVGAPYFDQYEGGDYQGKNYFVVEADEYAVDPPRDKTPKFNFMNPDIAICTNIDYDHPDVYESLSETKAAFVKFLKGKHVILCQDDQNLKSISRLLNQSKKETYGFSNESDLHVTNYRPLKTGSRFTLKHRNKVLGNYSVNLYGQKNVLNAAAVVLTLISLGFAAKDIKEAIRGFYGAKRRFEQLLHENDIYLFDDYGHHPQEIRATIQAAKDRFPDRRVIIIFQPHTYSRTKSMLVEFASSLSEASLSIVLPVFSSAREQAQTDIVKSEDVSISAKALKKTNVVAVNSKKEALQLLKEYLDKKDVIFTMGAGDVYKLKDDIISLIRK